MNPVVYSYDKLHEMDLGRKTRQEPDDKDTPLFFLPNPEADAGTGNSPVRNAGRPVRTNSNARDMLSSNIIPSGDFWSLPSKDTIPSVHGPCIPQQ